MNYTFGKDFLWGASSSAFQVEGAWDEDGKGMTVADFNSFKKSKIQADTKVASDFYHHWEEDIELMKELGMNIYRFSISWARIIPDGDGEINPKGLDFYNKVINRLIEYNIKPFITLYHFDLPYALVTKFNGWQDRRCIDAFEKFAKTVFSAFGDRVKYWQVVNEENLMMRIDERMNISIEDPHEREKVRAQMDYNMSVAHARSVILCHELVEGGKIGPAVSSTMTYPATDAPEDVLAAQTNDNYKTNYLLDLHYYGKYPGYYLHYLKTMDILPIMPKEDEDVLKQGKMDFIAFNYYRTNSATYLPPDDEHPWGTKETGSNQAEYNMYGGWKLCKNTHLKTTEYGWQIDPIGLRLVLNEYYNRYHLPLIITENGMGTADVLEENGAVHDEYRIEYVRDHIKQCYLAVQDGVELMGYCLWTFTDVLSSSDGFKKRYGFVYINRGEHDIKDLARIKKDSYYWYKKVIENRGIEV